ncbi:MAG: AAA family ATPase [Candidatus Gracilibacteria bacterium]|nr:AAA family ATPase [Candidatus Gracilibacteria bacterium]
MNTYQLDYTSLHIEHNNPGIEIFPIKNKKTGDFISLQAKFFENEIDYGNISHSIKIACNRKIAGQYTKLKVIHVYINKDWTDNKQKKEIEDLAAKSKISIAWVSGSDILYTIENTFEKLARLFFLKDFKSLRELDTNYGNYLNKTINENWLSINKNDIFLDYPLKDLYVPHNLTYNKSDSSIKVDDLYREIITTGRQDKANIYLIHGDPGVGKSSFSYYLLNKSNRPQSKINTVVIKLRDSLSIDAISDILKNKSIDILGVFGRYFSEKTINDLSFLSEDFIHSKPLLLILDGLDELFLMTSHSNVSIGLSSQFLSFLNENIQAINNKLNNGLRILITSRPLLPQSLGFDRENIQEYKLLSFNQEQINHFKMNLLTSADANKKKEIQEIFQQIDTLNIGYEKNHILKDPLILNMFFSLELKNEVLKIDLKSKAEFYNFFLEKYYEKQVLKVKKDSLNFEKQEYAKNLDLLSGDVAKSMWKLRLLYVSIMQIKDYLKTYGTIDQSSLWDSNQKILEGLLNIHVTYKDVNNSTIEFIHRSFSDYYLAKYIYEQVFSKSD